MTFYALLIMAIIVVLLLAEAMPEAVNALLILLLLGVVLGRYDKFQELIVRVTQINKT